MEILDDLVICQEHVQAAENEFLFTFKKSQQGISRMFPIERFREVFECQEDFQDVEVEFFLRSKIKDQTFRAECSFDLGDSVPEFQTPRSIRLRAVNVLKKLASRQLWSTKYSENDRDFQEILKIARVF